MRIRPITITSLEVLLLEQYLSKLSYKRSSHWTIYYSPSTELYSIKAMTFECNGLVVNKLNELRTKN